MGTGSGPGETLVSPPAPQGFRVPSKTKGRWGEQPVVGISTLTSSMEGSLGEQESFPGGMCCASSRAHKNKRQRHVGLEIKICGTWSETGEGWSVRDHQCVLLKLQPLMACFYNGKNKKILFLSIALEIILFVCCWILKFLFPIVSKIHVCWQNTSCKILNVALSKSCFSHRSTICFFNLMWLASLLFLTSPGQIQCNRWKDFASCSDNSTDIHEKS